MAIGSGIASQVVIGQESTVGTQVTPDLALEFTSEGVEKTKNVLQGTGLHAGGKFNRGALRSISTVAAAGDLVVPYRFNKMGRLWKNSLGGATTPTAVGTGSVAYKTLFTPASLAGLGLTYQKGVPSTGGTVLPFTFFGGKIAAWKWSVSVAALAEMTLTLDSWNVDTAAALVAASYATGNNTWAFNQGTTLKIGGTASTTSSVVTVASGVTVATLINSIELAGTNAMKVDRYGWGRAGVKAEQIENDMAGITCTLGGEFFNRTEFWDLWNTDTPFPLQFTLTGPAIAGSGGQTYSMDVILPACYIDTDDLAVGGPDVVEQSPVIQVLDDGVNAPIQVTLINTDSSL